MALAALGGMALAALGCTQARIALPNLVARPPEYRSRHCAACHDPTRRPSLRASAR
jgi:hypothetical protein